MPMRRTRLITLTLLPLLLTSCGTPTPPTPPQTVRTAPVQYRAITAGETLRATVEGKSTVEVAPKIGGRIATIARERGDRVHKGEILATLGNEEAGITVAGLGDVLSGIGHMHGALSDTIDAMTRVREATDTIYTSRIDGLDTDAKRVDIESKLSTDALTLARTLLGIGSRMGSGSTQSNHLSVLQAQQNLDLARTDYDAGMAVLSGTLVGSVQGVDQARRSLDFATTNLTNTTTALDAERATLHRNAMSALAGGYIVARDARDFIDTMLGVSDRTRGMNAVYSTYLSAKDTTVRTNAENAFRAWNSRYETLETWYLAHIDRQSDIPEETIRQGLTDAR